MKQILKTIFLIPFLVACSVSDKPAIKPDEDNIVIPTEYDYSDVFEKHIRWENMFEVDQNHYFVYFYSLTCSHCSDLKQFIIGKALDRDDIFFVRASASDSIKSDVSSTIGAGIAGEISILGYPSLIEIYDKICVKNVAGKTQIMRVL